jgi:hypothetical protein
VTIPEIVTVASHLLLARITAHPGDYDFLKTIATSIGLRGPWEFHPQDPLRLCLVDRLIFAGKNPPRRARPLTGWRTLAPCAR